MEKTFSDGLKKFIWLNTQSNVEHNYISEDFFLAFRCISYKTKVSFKWIKRLIQLSLIRENSIHFTLHYLCLRLDSDFLRNCILFFNTFEVLIHISSETLNERLVFSLDSYIKHSLIITIENHINISVGLQLNTGIRAKHKDRGESE